MRRTLAFIRERRATTGRPAVIAGGLASKAAVDAQGRLLVGDYSPQVVAAFDARYGGAFEPAEPPGFVPSCDQCAAPMNVFVGAKAPPTMLERLYLLGFPAGVSITNQLWGTENDVALGTAMCAGAPAPTGPFASIFPRAFGLLHPGALGH